MKCEDCDWSFRDGQKAYAIPTRVIIERNHTETFVVVDRMLCTNCYGRLRRAAQIEELMMPNS